MRLPRDEIIQKISGIPCFESESGKIAAVQDMKYIRDQKMAEPGEVSTSFGNLPLPDSILSSCPTVDFKSRGITE